MGRNLIRRSDIMSRVERLIANSDDDVDVIAIMNGGEPFLDSTFWYITEQCSGCFEGAMAFVSRSWSVSWRQRSQKAERVMCTSMRQPRNAMITSRIY